MSQYECTSVGKIASMFYFSPFDVSDLRRNFSKLFDEKRENNDHSLSISLANIDSYRWTICNKFEREAIAPYSGKIEKMYGVGKFTNGILKYGAAYFYSLKGKKDITQLISLQQMLLSDIDRTIQVLNAVDSMNCKWDRFNWFKMIALRLRYGVEPDLVELCQIPNVGQVRAKKLKDKRIKTLEDFLSYDADTIAIIMKTSKKLAEESLEAARLIQLKESL